MDTESIEHIIRFFIHCFFIGMCAGIFLGSFALAVKSVLKTIKTIIK